MLKRSALGLTIFACLGLAAGACGKKKKSTKTTADSPEAAKLLGQWTFDGARMVKANKKMSSAPKARQDMFIKLMSKAVMTIGKKTIKLEGVGKPKSQKYKVLSVEGKSVRLETTDEKGKVEKASYTLLSDNELKIVEDEGGDETIIFAKRK